MNRRKIVQTAVVASVLAGTSALAVAERPKTPRDYTGPFYPRGPRNRTSDLVVGTPQHEILHLTGSVISPNGTPYAKALVDIWHADPNGHYKHPRGRGQDQLLEEFLYWGESVTDENGRFTFRTYVPGSYAARPAQHIHYKVWSKRKEILTSQIYFAELGGDRGFARSEETAKLQTIHLVSVDESNRRAEIEIVI